MKGIDPKTCIHHIYIEKNSRPIKQPQRRMNSNLREIVKEELQKLLNVNFIYPISDNQWVSPLVIVPKKKGKWRVCIDYRELNKATLKDHFPFPFIDQVLDTLAGYETFVHTYHSAIRYLMNKPITNGKVIRWLLLLQELNIIVLDRPRKQNTVTDFLSRIPNIKEDSPIKDKFPNEYIFAVTTQTPWFVDVANYLVTGELPSHLLPREKRKIIQESARYSWIANEFHKTGPDLMIKRCVKEDEMPDILKSCHDEPCGGHFVNKRTTYKIISLGYYWPSIFKDAK
eukprot:PITA_29126